VRAVRNALFIAIAVLTAGLPSAAAGQPGAALRRTVFDDAFLLPPTLPPVEGFSAHGGSWRLRDGVLWAGGGPGPKLIANAPPFATGEVGVEVLLPDRRDGNAGLIVKVSQAAEGADRFNGYEIALYAKGQFLRLGRHRQDFRNIQDTPCPVPVNQWVPLVVRTTETTIEALVDGKTIVRYTDADRPLTTGSVGLRTWQREARFRNLWIRTGGRTRELPFKLPGPAGRGVSGGWQPFHRGTARAAFAIVPPGRAGPRQCQQVAFLQGRGQVGLRHPGPDPQGMAFAAGKPYEGLLEARADEPTSLVVAAERPDGTPLGHATIPLAAGGWQRHTFSITPSHDEPAGRVAVKLTAPGTALLRRLRLEPGPWAWPPTLSLDGLPPVAFITRQPLGRPRAVGQDLWASQPRGPGCSIRVVQPAHPDRPVTTLFSDPDGCIYDLNVTPDARTLLFSYRRKGEQHWHIWRIGADGSGLTQLTDGPFYDVSPCPLPDGDILFVSTRRFGYTVCQPGPAANLHRMAPDGSRIRCVSMNTLSDFSPHMLPDGRVLFTRWEYIDRDLTYRQSLWTQNPDGTAYQLYFGNTVRDVGTFWQARPLPGRSDRVVATFAPHHGFPHGAIGLIRRVAGVEGPRGTGYTWLTHEFTHIGDRSREWAYRDPFPLSDHTFLCAYGGGGPRRYRIVLLDDAGNQRLLYEDPQASCFFPIPLRPTPPPPVVAPRTRADDDHPTGTLLLLDAYQGLEPAIARGRAAAIRVMEQVRKTEDLHARAYDQSPVMSYGTYYAKRSWGTVPIRPDGSAHFRAPALREIYLQVLDGQGRELQRMTSAIQLMPGETLSCIGCHEPRQAPPPADRPVALAAMDPPADLRKPPWGNDGIIAFHSLVQPVLDKHCVRCHSGADPDGGYDLTGDKTRFFSMAYDNLLGRSRSYRQHDMALGHMLPAEAARGKPLVHFFWLLRTPTAVNQPLWTGSHASRLLDTIETEHCEHPIPLADRQRIYAWVDANVPYYATYAHSHPHSPGRRDLWTHPATGRLAPWFARDFTAVYNRRCLACHGKLEGTTDWTGRYAWLNLTRPHLSPALTAHLAKPAGGRGIDKTPDAKPIPLFATTTHPDYQAMLRAIQAGAALARKHPEPDMPGYTGRRKEP